MRNQEHWKKGNRKSAPLRNKIDRLTLELIAVDFIRKFRSEREHIEVANEVIYVLFVWELSSVEQTCLSLCVPFLTFPIVCVCTPMSMAYVFGSINAYLCKVDAAAAASVAETYINTTCKWKHQYICFDTWGWKLEPVSVVYFVFVFSL